MSIHDEEGPDYSEDTFTPPEPLEKPVLDLKVSNYDLGRIVDQAVYAAIERHVKKAVDKFVEKKVAKAVDALVKEISTATITAHVEKALAEGWGKVNEWGEQRGEKITLSTVVRDGLLAMSKVPERAYHDKSTPPSPIETIVQEMAAASIKEGLAPILAEAKEQLKTQLDLSIGKSLRLTIGELAKG